MNPWNKNSLYSCFLVSVGCLFQDSHLSLGPRSCRPPSISWSSWSLHYIHGKGPLRASGLLVSRASRYGTDIGHPGRTPGRALGTLLGHCFQASEDPREGSGQMCAWRDWGQRAKGCFPACRLLFKYLNSSITQPLSTSWTSSLS